MKKRIDAIAPLNALRPIPVITQKDIEDLPEDIKRSITHSVQTRLRLGLDDDMEQRLTRAAQYKKLYP